MNRRTRLFNPTKRRVLRKRITPSEVLFGVAFCLLLAVSTIWVVAQKNNYDPADRDVSFEVLEKDSNEGSLYIPPLKRWSEPGSTPAAQGGVDLGLFPAGLLDGGWQIDGRVETYDADTLYEKINGAADLYIAFGFRRLHYVTLAQDSRFLNVELYDQGDLRNVIGLFSAQKDADRDVLRRGEVFYYPTSVGVIGGYWNFYFKIAGSGSDDATLDKATSLIDLIADLPAGAGQLPRPFRVLTEGLGIPSERLDYHLKDVFQYDFLTDFWFARVADQGETRYFIHESDDPATASALYTRLAEEQEVEYSVIEKDDDNLILQHRFLNTFFAMRLEGGAILGIDGAPNAETARNLIDDLKKAFDGREETDPEA